MRQKKQKIKEYNKRKNLVYMFGVLSIMATLAMFGLFIFSSNKIHEMVLDKEMEQNELVTSYITSILNSEMEDCLEILYTSEEFLSTYKKDRQEEVTDSLRKIKEGTVFEYYGIMDLEGNSINDSGKSHRITNPQLMEAIHKDESYISDVQTEVDVLEGEDTGSQPGWVMLAVPLHHQGRIIGAVWGAYPISILADKVERTGDTQRYFQIIDNEGNYISRSASGKSFAKSLPLWEELKRYEFLGGENANTIRAKVNKHEKGRFSFRYQGKKRYVAYEPLGVNNWYVFSVLVGESIDSYVKNIREISTTLMLGFTMFITMIFSGLFLIGNWNRRLMEQKNHQLAVTTQLFQIIMQKTKDIPFEISLQKRTVKLYRSAKDSNEEEILDNISPENMLLEGKIRLEDMERYKTFYDDIFHGKIEGGDEKTLVLEMKLRNEWNWMKIHILTVDEKSMIGFLEDYNEQVKRKQELEEAQQKTKYDVLTGLYNRETFIQKVSERLKQKKYQSEEISALFLLDLDYFKEINDTFGHMMGDQVLRDVAQSLKAVIRSSDLAGRLGGDEFVVFLDNVSNEEALRKCADKINRVLVKNYEKAGNRVQVSSSIGIVKTEPGRFFSDLYEKADLALYEVKRQGRNGYKIWNEQE